jgi:serine/threonine-protein kinase RsbW
MVAVPSWSRFFPGRADQVAQARQFVMSVLAGRPEAETAALVVSELSTNAVCHTASGGPDGLFAVTVWREEDRATVTVQDMAAAGEPAIRAPEGDAPGESGRVTAGGGGGEGLGRNAQPAGLAGVGRAGQHGRGVGRERAAHAATSQAAGVGERADGGGPLPGTV